MCKTPTAGDNNAQMIDRNFLSWLATKSIKHLYVNVEKHSLKMKQKQLQRNYSQDNVPPLSNKWRNSTDIKQLKWKN